MNEYSEALERLLADASTPAAVRAIEDGGPAEPLWDAIEDSGFLDALVPEARGGAGLSLAQAFGLLLAEGRHVVPAPFGHTLLVRAALASEGGDAPPGPIAIAASTEEAAGGELTCRHVAGGMVAQWVIAVLPGRWLLLPVAVSNRSESGIHGSLRADLQWTSATQAVHASKADVPWRELGAVAGAAQIAGALERVLEMSVQFANDRVQFGRAIGKFQAIQHQLAVMAEHVAAARMAAQIGCESPSAFPDPLRAAVAKARTSEAAALVAPSAHAIHGAIGVTAELDLQLFTRRVHELRADFGSESAWNRVLGRALFDSDEALAVDFMRTRLLPLTGTAP